MYINSKSRGIGGVEHTVGLVCGVLNDSIALLSTICQLDE